MAASTKNRNAQSRTSRKAPEQARSRSQAAAPAKRAQPKSSAGSQAATKTMRLPTTRRSQSGSRTSGAQDWLSSIETMITTREGREIIAEALRALATVLDHRNERDQGTAAGGARSGGEAVDPGMQTSEPIANPVTEMAAGALGMAQTVTELVTDAATAVMPGGMAAAAGSEDSGAGRGAGTRRSSRKRSSSGSA